jgi:hypothetical protein
MRGGTQSGLLPPAMTSFFDVALHLEHLSLLPSARPVVGRRITPGRTMKSTVVILAAMAALSPTAAMAQTMFKCVQDGKTVYQAEPCPDSARQDKLKVQVAPAATPVAQGGGGGSKDTDRMIDFMATYRVCADAVQMWGQEMAAPYSAWRNKNLSAVTRIEKDPGLRARYDLLVSQKRSGKASMCRDVALELRGKK